MTANASENFNEAAQTIYSPHHTNLQTHSSPFYLTSQREHSTTFRAHNVNAFHSYRMYIYISIYLHHMDHVPPYNQLFLPSARLFVLPAESARSINVYSPMLLLLLLLLPYTHPSTYENSPIWPSSSDQTRLASTEEGHTDCG